jgi:RNA polymerase sigma-70 factor (ECF subfamily)
MSGMVDVFEMNRRRLLAVAHRMLGSRSDAEDLIQDVWLRWNESATADIQSPVAFLVTITKRLCLDRIRERKNERGQYAEASLPDLLAEEYVPSAEARRELVDQVSAAFRAVLERLGPEERTGFLLRDIFDYDYSEVAQVVGKAEPTCRQMVRRARARVQEPRQRFSVTAESRERVLKTFLGAIDTGDRQAVQALLAEEIEYAPRG